MDSTGEIGSIKASNMNGGIPSDPAIVGILFPQFCWNSNGFISPHLVRSNLFYSKPPADEPKGKST